MIWYLLLFLLLIAGAFALLMHTECNEQFQDFVPRLTQRIDPNYFVQLFAAIQQNKLFVQNYGIRDV
jgi:hypothetical protein